MFCQQNIINLLTKLVKKYVYHAHHPAFALFWHEMRLFCSVFSNLRSWQDFSILAPPLSDVKFSFLTLRRVEKKGIFFLHQTQKCGCYKFCLLLLLPFLTSQLFLSQTFNVSNILVFLNVYKWTRKKLYWSEVFWC